MDNINLEQVPTPVESTDDFQQIPQQQFEEAPTSVDAQTEEPTLAQQLSSGDLLNIEVTDEIVALNMMVSFLNLAASRNAFSMQETSKIWQCVEKFIKK